ncbi:MAG: hypothetical protein AAGK37_00325 [Pseudomonadota bacterium]
MKHPNVTGGWRCAGVVLVTGFLGVKRPANAPCDDALRLQDLMAAYTALLADPARAGVQGHVRAILAVPEGGYADHVSKI